MRYRDYIEYYKSNKRSYFYGLNYKNQIWTLIHLTRVDLLTKHEDI